MADNGKEMTVQRKSKPSIEEAKKLGDLMSHTYDNINHMMDKYIAMLKEQLSHARRSRAGEEEPE